MLNDKQHCLQCETAANISTCIALYFCSNSNFRPQWPFSDSRGQTSEQGITLESRDYTMSVQTFPSCITKTFKVKKKKKYNIIYLVTFSPQVSLRSGMCEAKMFVIHIHCGFPGWWITVKESKLVNFCLLQAKGWVPLKWKENQRLALCSIGSRTVIKLDKTDWHDNKRQNWGRLPMWSSFLSFI